MRRAAAAVLLALLAAGCATTEPGSDAPPPAPASTLPTFTVPAPQPVPPPTGGPVTVDGVVEKGVEPGCLVLRTGTRSYLLQGARASSAPVAVPVRVTGELVESVANYRQQGTPLQVTSISRR